MTTASPGHPRTGTTTRVVCCVAATLLFALGCSTGRAGGSGANLYDVALVNDATFGDAPSGDTSTAGHDAASNDDGSSRAVDIAAVDVAQPDVDVLGTDAGVVLGDVSAGGDGALTDSGSPAADSGSLPDTPSTDAPSTGDSGAGDDAGTGNDTGASGDGAASDGLGADGGPAADAGDGLPYGGPVGGQCKGLSGTVTCSNDWKHRVMCVNGAWTSLQHCGFGACKRFKSAGGAVLSECFVPKVKHKALARACSRYLKCYNPPMSLEDCVRLNLHGKKLGASIPAGQVREVHNVAVYQLLDALKCIDQTKTCNDLAQCLHWFPVDKCGKATNAGCDAQVAWACKGHGKPVAASCGALGMTCHVFGGKATCAKSLACKAPKASCTGLVAKDCIKDAEGSTVGVVSDCALIGNTCKHDLATDTAGCDQPLKCTTQFKPTCDATGATNCVSGVKMKRVCGLGQSCKFLDHLGHFASHCPIGIDCKQTGCSEGGTCSAPPFCKGHIAHYCEGGWPVALDCKSIGMSCANTKFGVRCQ